MLIFLDRVLFPWLANNDPRNRRYRLPIFAVIIVVLNLLYKHYFPATWDSFLGITLIVIGWITFLELNQFWSLGLVGADRETRSGINYKRALSLCTTSLDFLGIGAGKLHEEQRAFEDAINRCSRADRAVRFLLCRPDSEGLRKIAQSAKRDENLFRKVVLETLRALAVLKKEQAKNVEVRLYDDFPVFRLMFINDEICLASHYVLGKGGDGSEAPQMHVVKIRASRDVESLYFGFRSYFDRVWQESSEWDFDTYL